MRLSQALYVVRRWRSLVVAGVLIGVVVGWLSAPGKTAAGTTYQATHSLLGDPQSRATSLVEQAALMAKKGAVPDRVAVRLGVDGQFVRSSVTTETPPNENLLLITGRSRDAHQAEALANVTAEELIVQLGGVSKSPLKTLELAVASPVRTGDIKGPTSHTGRALLLGVFGLLLGLGATLVVERLDNRIRTKETAEEVLHVSVMTEVPLMTRAERDRLVTGAESSPVLEAYRGLRTAVDQWTPGIEEGDGHRLIVVASATGREGTTTTVAHLATTLAEIGRSVLAISADMRRPSLHRFFDKPEEPGLTDVLRGAPDVRRLTDLNLATTLRGVRFVASGAPVRNPSPLVDQLGGYLKEARELGDFVLVDTPPLLTTSEAADIAHHADGVLLVIRAGRTSVGAAARTAEMLERLNVPLIGAVLVGGDVGRVRR